MPGGTGPHRDLDPELQSHLDADRLRDMSIAVYLHDIGKSGPFDVPQATQEAVVKLYAVETVPDPEQTIAEMVRTNFSSEDAASIPKRLGHAACVEMRLCAHLGSRWLLDARHPRS